MSVQRLSLLAVDGTFAICRLDPHEPVPACATSCPVWSVTRTADELSIVCAESAVPNGVPCERGWRCLRVAGPIPFSAIGVLASLTAPLAGADVSIFAISTFDTDYLLVKAVDYERAVSVLRKAGHTAAEN